MLDNWISSKKSLVKSLTTNSRVDIIPLVMTHKFSKRTTPAVGKNKNVERQLYNTTRRLVDTEINIGMFSKMIKKGISTNDVYYFVKKQSELRKSSNSIDYKLMKANMKQKLNDSCSYAKRLRQKKKGLVNKIFTMHEECKSKAIKVMEENRRRCNTRREKMKEKSERKITHLEKKQKGMKELEGIPKDTKKILEHVNIFNETITPENPIGPMVCSNKIKLSDNEIAFLNKGPGFMMRCELDETEFETELEKMIIKRKFKERQEETEDVEDGETGVLTDEERKEEERIKSEIERQEAQSRMMYNKGDMRVDMGNLRASDYKYNKSIHIPKSGDAQKETLHRIRKEEMKRVFDRTIRQ